MEIEGAIYPSLKGRTVFITGGGSGIGASIVEHFCAQACRVAFVDIADAASKALVDDIAAKGHVRPENIRCDLRDIASLQAIVERVGRVLGPLRVLVTNAGNDDRHHFSKVTPDYWDDRVAANLRHQCFTAQTVHPQMKVAGGGSIVNFGSISWMNAEGEYAAYTACKAAVHGLTRSLARDFGPDRIRANTVVPGWVMTERQVALWLDADGERQIAEMQCLREKVYPPDIARMVLWLAADEGVASRERSFGSIRSVGGS